MADLLKNILIRVENLITEGLNAATTGEILHLIEGATLSQAILDRVMLYNETLPRAAEFPYTRQQRYLHFLWDAFDKTALSLMVPFSIPFRRLIGKYLFKSCGNAMIAEENVRFNFGHLLELGDGVFFNRGFCLTPREVLFLATAWPWPKTCEFLRTVTPKRRILSVVTDKLLSKITLKFMLGRLICRA